MSFTGTYYYQIDPRGRMRMPKNFISQLGKDLHIGFGTGKFLVVYTAEKVEELAQKMGEISPDDIGSIKMYRKLFSSMKEFTCDAQGRYKIPLDYCERFGLKDDIVIVGNCTQVEIWSKENFELCDEDEISFSVVMAEKKRKAQREVKEQLLKKQMQQMLEDDTDSQ